MPPNVGPIAGVIPTMNPNSPINTAHFSSGIILKINIWHIGIRIPVPIASKILPTINIPMFVDKKQIADPIMNNMRDAVSIVLILNLLVMYAVGGIITPRTNRNTEYVHCAVAEDTEKSSI